MNQELIQQYEMVILLASLSFGVIGIVVGTGIGRLIYKKDK